MNLRPSGYEPDELPDCSTPHQPSRILAVVRPGPQPAIAKVFSAPLAQECLVRYSGGQAVCAGMHGQLERTHTSRVIEDVRGEQQFIGTMLRRECFDAVAHGLG